MLIFGWGRRTRNVEATIARPCERCTQSQVFNLERIRTWFTLFFIPVIPYETEHWLLCAECRCGFKLTQEEYDGLKAELAGSETQTAYMTLTRS
jgi:hypothetical protein